MKRQSIRLAPTRCYWCDTGRVKRNKCQGCGATYGSDFKKPRSEQPKRTGGFSLPSIADFKRKTFKELTQQ